MKRTISAITGVMAAVCFAVDYAGPGGDMADPANWGGTLPDNATAVSFGPSAVPSTGLTLSDHVAFGATTIAAGFADGLLFDLAGYSYTGAGLTVKSDATFQDGFFTNTALTVAAGTTLTLSGAEGDCELRLTSDCAPFSSGATLHVTDGATFRPGGKGFQTTASNTTMMFDNGATLDCTGMTSEYNIAFLFKSVANVTLVVDNATAKFFTLNAGGKSSGTLGMVRNSLFSFRNGSTVTFTKHSNGMNTRGFYLGSSGDNARSNLLEVISSSFRIAAESSLHLDGRYNAVVVRNSTFNAKVETHASGCCNTILYDRSAVSGDITLRGSSNTLDAVNCSAFPKLTVVGKDNVVTLVNPVNSSISLGGTNNTVTLAAGGILTALPSFTDDSECSNRFVIDGGAITNTSFKFTGTNHTVIIRNGGRLQYGTGGVVRDAFNFEMGKTKNYTVKIEDGGTIGIRGMVNFTTNESFVYNWTNCPNCAIEFSGRNPSLVCHDYTSNYETLGLGTRDEQPLVDAVKLRFVIPAGGYAETPIRNTVRKMWLWGNQPIEIVMADEDWPERTLLVPLIYDTSGFSDTKMTEARLATLESNATFPQTGKGIMCFYYDSAAKTLGVKIIPTNGTMIIFR